MCLQRCFSRAYNLNLVLFWSKIFLMCDETPINIFCTAFTLQLIERTSNQKVHKIIQQAVVYRLMTVHVQHICWNTVKLKHRNRNLNYTHLQAVQKVLEEHSFLENIQYIFFCTQYNKPYRKLYRKYTLTVVQRVTLSFVQDQNTEIRIITLKPMGI